MSTWTWHIVGFITVVRMRVPFSRMMKNYTYDKKLPYLFYILYIFAHFRLVMTL